VPYAGGGDVVAVPMSALIQSDYVKILGEGWCDSHRELQGEPPLTS